MPTWSSSETRKRITQKWFEFDQLYDNVMYIPPDQQFGLGLKSCDIPWNRFGRKSIDFLGALKNGAEIVYDFDDDNHLTVSSFDALMNSPEVEFLKSDHHLLNPSPYGLGFSLKSWYVFISQLANVLRYGDHSKHFVKIVVSKRISFHRGSVYARRVRGGECRSGNVRLMV